MEQVFRETTAWVIEENGWLGISCPLQPRRRLDMLRGWPSWVPDYNASLSPYPLLMEHPSFLQDRVEAHSEFVTQETRPEVCGRWLTVSVKCIGVVADVGDTWTSMIDDGCFELTARLLLKYPDIVNGQGKSRIDTWIDTLAARSSADPVNADERAAFKHWLAFYI